MARCLEVLVRKFANVRLVTVSSSQSVVEFLGWRSFRVFPTGDVIEIVGQNDYTTEYSQWLQAILQGKKRDAFGNMI